MNTTRKMLWTIALVTPLVGVGCGGDSGRNDNRPAATAVPDSAGISVAAFLAFIASLASDDETSEPLTISDTFAVPADEANEPDPLT